jgi:hypothetical protein
MKAIDRKLVRDMAHMWGQILAICAVIEASVLGIAWFTMTPAELLGRCLDRMQTRPTRAIFIST